MSLSVYDSPLFSHAPKCRYAANPSTAGPLPRCTWTRCCVSLFDLRHLFVFPHLPQYNTAIHYSGTHAQRTPTPPGPFRLHGPGTEHVPSVLAHHRTHMVGVHSSCLIILPYPPYVFRAASPVTCHSRDAASKASPTLDLDYCTFLTKTKERGNTTRLIAMLNMCAR